VYTGDLVLRGVGESREDVGGELRAVSYYPLAAEKRAQRNPGTQPGLAVLLVADLKFGHYIRRRKPRSTG
jgi:hypothetical protein